MNNKGFAITGIIYTLFILFLMILLTVLTGLSSYQKLMINSTRSLENSFEGEEIGDDPSNLYYDFDDIEEYKKAYYLGKYVFKIDENNDGVINNLDTIDTECSVYLKKDTLFYDNTNEFSANGIKLSPQICNESNFSYKLILDRVYSFEGDKYEKN